MKYAFYISGKSDRLKSFLSQPNLKWKDKIKLVVSDSEIVSEELCILLDRYSVKTVICNWKLLKNNKNERFSDQLLKNLVEQDIDYCYSFGSHILKGKLLETYKNRIINFHPSLLPMFPGLYSIDQAVQDGHSFLVGNTAHFIDKDIDTGPIIMQSAIPLKAFTLTNDYNTVLDLQIKMLNQLFEVIEAERLFVHENEVIIENADYKASMIYPKIE